MRRKIDTFAKLMSRWAKKYAGKCVAAVKDKIVAVGETRLEVFKEARKKYPKEKLGIYYIPTAKEMITALCNFLMHK
jgi:hypothetical protein